MLRRPISIYWARLEIYQSFNYPNILSILAVPRWQEFVILLQHAFVPMYVESEGEPQLRRTNKCIGSHKSFKRYCILMYRPNLSTLDSPSPIGILPAALGNTHPPLWPRDAAKAYWVSLTALCILNTRNSFCSDKSVGILKPEINAKSLMRRSPACRQCR